MIRQAEREGKVASAAAHVGIVDVALVSTPGFCSADQKSVQLSRYAEAFDRRMCPHCLLYKVLNLRSGRGCVHDLLIDFSTSGLRSSCCSSVDPFGRVDFVENRLALHRIEKLELDVVH